MIDYITKNWKCFLFGGFILFMFFIGLFMANIEQVDSFMTKPLVELQVIEFIVVAIIIKLIVGN